MNYKNISAPSPSSSVHNKEEDNINKLEKRRGEEQTLRVIRKQDQIAGEARNKTINDFPYAAAIAQALKDLEFPADKEKIIEFLQQQQSKDPQIREVLTIIQQQIQEQKEYKNVADITKAARLVEE